MPQDRHPQHIKACATVRGFTLVEIVLILAVAVVLAILAFLAIRALSGAGAPAVTTGIVRFVLSNVANPAPTPTQAVVDVLGEFTPLPSRFLAVRRPQQVVFTLTILPAGTLSSNGSFPPGTPTTPLPNTSVNFTVSGPLTFTGSAASLTATTDAQGRATVSVLGNPEVTGTATLTASVTFTDSATGQQVTGTEQIMVPVERP